MASSTTGQKRGRDQLTGEQAILEGNGFLGRYLVRLASRQRRAADGARAAGAGPSHGYPNELPVAICGAAAAAAAAAET